MHRVCPKPLVWSKVFLDLEGFAQFHPCTPGSPPKPLILGGWTYSNDAEKLARWQDTVSWASRNGCAPVVEAVSDADFYYVEALTTYTVGPTGGPMYLPWSFTPKPKVSDADRHSLLERLRQNWEKVASPELASATCPIALTGAKARRLLVHVAPGSSAPWGNWSSLSHRAELRRSFTRFRASVNAALSPHHVDHIDFAPDA